MTKTSGNMKKIKRKPEKNRSKNETRVGISQKKLIICNFRGHKMD